MRSISIVFYLFVCCISAFSQSKWEVPVSGIIPEGRYYVDYGHIGEWSYLPDDYSLVERYSLVFNSHSGAYSMVLTLVVPYKVDSGLEVKLYVGTSITDISYYTYEDTDNPYSTVLILPMSKSIISKALHNSESVSCLDFEQDCYCEAFLYVEDPNKGIYFVVYPTSREWFVSSLNKINALNSLRD